MVALVLKVPMGEVFRVRAMPGIPIPSCVWCKDAACLAVVACHHVPSPSAPQSTTMERLILVFHSEGRLYHTQFDTASAKNIVAHCLSDTGAVTKILVDVFFVAEPAVAASTEMLWVASHVPQSSDSPIQGKAHLSIHPEAYTTACLSAGNALIVNFAQGGVKRTVCGLIRVPVVEGVATAGSLRRLAIVAPFPCRGDGPPDVFNVMNVSPTSVAVTNRFTLSVSAKPIVMESSRAATEAAAPPARATIPPGTLSGASAQKAPSTDEHLSDSDSLASEASMKKNKQREGEARAKEATTQAEKPQAKNVTQAEDPQAKKVTQAENPQAKKVTQAENPQDKKVTQAENPQAKKAQSLEVRAPVAVRTCTSDVSGSAASTVVRSPAAESEPKSRSLSSTVSIFSPSPSNDPALPAPVVKPVRDPSEPIARRGFVSLTEDKRKSLEEHCARMRDSDPWGLGGRPLHPGCYRAYDSDTDRKSLACMRPRVEHEAEAEHEAAAAVGSEEETAATGTSHVTVNRKSKRIAKAKKKSAKKAEPEEVVPPPMTKKEENKLRLAAAGLTKLVEQSGHGCPQDSIRRAANFSDSDDSVVSRAPKRAKAK